jgi:competence protein ComEC
MKRPVCICCGVLLAALLAADLVPQAVFWMPAAFLVCVGIVLLFLRRKALGACILIGAALAVLIFGQTLLTQERPAKAFCGRTVMLTAQVEETQPSYAEDRVNAKLYVQRVNGKEQSFFCRCACLPECEIGQTIQGNFTISPVSAGRWRLSEYADGVFVMAEYEQSFSITEEAHGLRAVCAEIQNTLSSHIRRYLSLQTGGILAAMTVGDRRFVDPELKKAYQNAGIPHVLVVSGLHLSLLCQLVPLRKRRGQAAARCFGAIANAGIAAALIGITGASPSVVRAGWAVILCSVAVLLGRPADPLTSLAVVGAAMSFGNAYAICDIAFELSFAATAGVLFASGQLRHYKRRARRREKAQKHVRPAASAGPGRLENLLRRAGQALLESFAVSGCASLFTLPVLVLRGMDVSAVSVLTNLATLWLLSPILVCGLLCAALGFFPQLDALLRLSALAGGLLVRLLNTLVCWFAAVPGAHLHAETGYPAAVAFLLAGFVAAAAWKKLPWRKTLPTAAGLLCFAVLLSAGLSKDLVKVALIGNARVPAIVITQNGQADVLFRGGTYNAQKIEEYLEQENIDGIHTLVDLRFSPERECELSGEQRYAFSDVEDGDVQYLKAGELPYCLCRAGNGGYVMLLGGQYTIMTSVGTPRQNGNTYPVELMLATGSTPAALRPEAVLTLSDSYSWLDSTGAKRIYYGQTGAAVWLRTDKPGRRWKVRFTGVDAWPMRQSCGS